MNIKFSPPNISENAINSVIETLRSGWITTGPKVKEFEKQLTEYMGTSATITTNSATAALEAVLRVLEIGEGDEVITSAYTYTASAAVIHHVGAKIILVDTQKNSLEMNYEQLKEKITPRTKAIIPVDIAGKICDYKKLFEIVEEKKKLFSSQNKLHQKLARIAIISDAAHSFGAEKNNKKSGKFADFTCFSFHAVKNLTTGEGGAITWNNLPINPNNLYKIFSSIILHGQTKDAFSKMEKGNWEYDIELLGYKSNMTDISASIGIEQLKEYDSNLARRKEIVNYYNEHINSKLVEYFPHIEADNLSSCHLYLTWVKGFSEVQRNELIVKMADVGIATNVHYKPLPLFTSYQQYGFKIGDYQNAFSHYQNEITLPLYPQLTNTELEYIVEHFNRIIEEMERS